METCAAPSAQAPQAHTETSSSLATTTHCPLLEKLPPELRVEIFRIVLGAEQSVTNVKFWKGWLPSDKPVFNTALFTVCRLVSLEAQDVFYEVNKIWVADVSEPYKSRSLTRHLQFRELFPDWASELQERYVQAAIDAFVRLPKLKYVLIEVTTRHQQGFQTLSDCVSSQGSSFEHRFVSLGLVEVPVRSPRKGIIFFKDVAFIDLLQHAKRLLAEHTPEELRVVCDEFRKERRRQIRPSGEYRIDVDHFYRACTALWFAAVERWRNGTWPDNAEYGCVKRVFRIATLPGGELEVVVKQIPKTTRLIDVTLAEHGEYIIRRLSVVLRSLLPVREVRSAFG